MQIDEVPKTYIAPHRYRNLFILGALILVVLIIIVIVIPVVVSQQNNSASSSATTATTAPTKAPTTAPTSPATTAPTSTFVPPTTPTVAVSDEFDWTLQGGVLGGNFGDCATSTDVNEDGYDDLLIGAPGESAVYLLKGRDVGKNYPTLNFASFDLSQGIKFIGASPTDLTGQAVATGDINGDGYKDVILNAGQGGSNLEGVVYVIYGSLALFNQNFDLGNLLNNPDATVGVVIHGSNALANTGAGLFGSDLNGDGYADILIGAPNATFDGIDYTGASYVIWGGPSLPATINLGSLSPIQGLTFLGANDGDQLGFVTATVNDMNGDGLNDFAMSAPTYQGNYGAVYVFYGRRTAFPLSRISVASIPEALGFTVIGNAGDLLGWDLSLAGDFNNDGLADVIAGAPGDPSITSLPGYAAIIFGSTTHSPFLPVSTFNGVNGVTITGENPGDQFGFAVGPAGDFNLDGVVDVNVGATGAHTNGAVWVLYGHTGAYEADFNLKNWVSNAGELYTSPNTSGLGVEVWGGFDFNGDGRADFAWGEPDEDPNNISEGGILIVAFNRRGLTQ